MNDRKWHYYNINKLALPEWVYINSDSTERIITLNDVHWLTGYGCLIVMHWSPFDFASQIFQISGCDLEALRRKLLRSQKLSGSSHDRHSLTMKLSPVDYQVWRDTTINSTFCYISLFAQSKHSLFRPTLEGIVYHFKFSICRTIHHLKLQSGTPLSRVLNSSAPPGTIHRQESV